VEVIKVKSDSRPRPADHHLKRLPEKFTLTASHRFNGASQVPPNRSRSAFELEQAV